MINIFQREDMNEVIEEIREAVHDAMFDEAINTPEGIPGNILVWIEGEYSVKLDDYNLLFDCDCAADQDTFDEFLWDFLYEYLPEEDYTDYSRRIVKKWAPEYLSSFDALVFMQKMSSAYNSIWVHEDYLESFAHEEFLAEYGKCYEMLERYVDLELRIEEYEQNDSVTFNTNYVQGTYYAL